MTYSKPEVIVLGEAARLVLGQRVSGSELPQGDSFQGTDCELDE